MQLSVYEISVQQFILTLSNLKNILQKSQTLALARRFDFEVLLNTRLFPDMFPLGKQIQTACDAAKFCAHRLSQIDAPTFSDSEGNLDDYFKRIDGTIAYLKSLGPEDFEEFEKKKIRFSWNPQQELQGKDYLIQFAVPNFYFHITTAYNILRHCGVELGKADYLGPINWQAVTQHP